MPAQEWIPETLLLSIVEIHRDKGESTQTEVLAQSEGIQRSVTAAWEQWKRNKVGILWSQKLVSGNFFQIISVKLLSRGFVS